MQAVAETLDLNDQLFINIYIYVYIYVYNCEGGTRWRSWLRHCATSRKGAGSIPDGFTGIFHWHYPFGRTMAGVDPASNRNEYQEYSLGVKVAGT